MTLSNEHIFQTLQQRAFVQVPFPLERQVYEEAIAAFFKFLDEPDPIKNYIDLDIAPEHRRGDVGFKHRNADDHIYNDDKSFFHYHPAILAKYGDFLATHPVVNDFITKAQSIWELTQQTVHNVLQSFEGKFPGTVGRVFDTDTVHIMLRFLKYDWQASGKHLAKPHFDAGSFTLAIAESCPGLRIGHGPEDLQLVEHKEKHALFMISSNFRKIMDTDILAPGWHDVIQLDESLVGKPFARWAIVAFIEAHGVTALPRSETHKWALTG